MRRVLARAVTLTLILNMSLLFPTEVRAARYVDMPGNWAERYVNQLSDEGVIPAEKDGRFRPDDPVTRAVLSYWLVNTLGIKDQSVPSTPSFNDVKPEDWYYKPVELVKQNSYIAGYSDGFRPNQFIQRGEVIAILARTLSTANPDEATITKELAKYKDGSQVPTWARAGVAKASLAGIKIGYQSQKDSDDGKPKEIKAATIASRADTASLLFALDDYRTQKQIADATSRAEAGLPPASSGQNQKPQLQGQQPQFGQQPQNSQQPQFGQQQMAGGPPPAGYPVSPAFSQNNSAPPLGQPAMAQGGYGGQYLTQGGYPPPQQYQGQVQQQFQPQGGYGGQAYGGGGGYPPPGGFGGYPPQQGQYGGGGYPPPNYLQGRVAIVAAGTEFRAALVNTLDSGSTQPGEQVQATLSQPLYANGQEVVPAGSKLIGNVTNVVSAKRFKFGANGRIDVRFTSIETPDGRRFPLSASINQNEVSLTGGTTKGRVGKTLMYTGGGALGGAALGTGLGAITGGLSRGSVGMSTGMGAAFGSAMGGIVGLGAGAIRKGGECKLIAGEALPIKLDESLQIAGGGGAPMQQPYGFAPGGGYPPPVQQPAGGYYPQQ